MKRKKNDLYAECKYEMFPEMAGEFKKEDHPEKQLFKLNPVEYAADSYYFEHRLELPYGKLTVNIKVGAKQQEGQELALSALPDGEKFDVRIEPEPMSLAQLRERHELEEAEGEKREQEARLAQKRTQELKQKIRYEQEQQIAKQEQNTAELKVYFEAINLGLHKIEEDFNASMSVLSIHHQELMDNFRYYSQLQAQGFSRDENKFIILQSFLHFMRVMKIAATREEALAAAECMHQIDGVHIPFSDTLNISNGLNYAQFLEAILRIAYWLKDNGPEKNNEDGFANTLETLFSEAELDIKKLGKNDIVISTLLGLADSGLMRDQYTLLGAIFDSRALPSKEEAGVIELRKADFIELLKESNLLIFKKEEEKKDGKKDA